MCWSFRLDGGPPAPSKSRLVDGEMIHLPPRAANPAGSGDRQRDQTQQWNNIIALALNDDVQLHVRQKLEVGCGNELGLSNVG